MNGPFSRDDILARVRARLALDPALVYARRRAAFDATDACMRARRTDVRGLRLF